MNDKGIECGVHYQPVYSFSYYRKKFNWKAKSFPQTAKAAERIVTLPLYPTLSDDLVEYIGESVHSILMKHRKRSFRKTE
jgi:dTDP-4-amino-4,6-dideoxygalactose transaminase